MISLSYPQPKRKQPGRRSHGMPDNKAYLADGGGYDSEDYMSQDGTSGVDDELDQEG